MSKISLSAGGLGGLNTRAAAQVEAALAEYENDPIGKAETLAYEPQPSWSGAPSLSPLTTQSIQGTMDDETYKSRHLWLWQRISKIVVTKSLTHEATVVKSNGNEGIDPFFSEGGVNAFSEAEFERIYTQAKFMSENIEVPDTAAVIRGGLDGNSTALETRTRLGIKMLLGRIERWLIEGDSDVSSLQIDGIRKGVLARGVYKDMAGEAPTSEDIEDVVGELQADGRYALDLEAFTDPRVKRVLTTLDAASGRYPKDRGGVTSRIGGPSDVVLTTEYGDSPVYSMPLIGMPDSFSASALGSGPPTGCSAKSYASGVNALSKFVATDVGDIDFRVIPVGDKGTGAPIEFNNKTVVAGNSMTLTIEDSAVVRTKNTAAMIRYYRVYATEPDGTAFGYIGQYPAAAFGSDTEILIHWDRRPFKRPIFIGEFNESTLQWVQVMEMIRRPLAQVQSSIPFMLQLWGNLFFKQSQKWAIIDNCALKAT